MFYYICIYIYRERKLIQVDTDKLPVKERFIIVDDMLKRN